MNLEGNMTELTAASLSGCSVICCSFRKKKKQLGSTKSCRSFWAWLLRAILLRM